MDAILRKSKKTSKDKKKATKAKKKEKKAKQRKKTTFFRKQKNNNNEKKKREKKTKKKKRKKKKGCCSESPRTGGEQDRKWTDSVEFGERFYTEGAKEQRTRRWQRPREKTAAVKTREEGARIQEGALLSSFATAETNEQTEVRIVEPLEAPHDTRICIEDLVDTDIDESDIDELRDDKKRKQPGNGTQEQMRTGTQEPLNKRAVPTAGGRIRFLIRWCTRQRVTEMRTKPPSRRSRQRWYGENREKENAVFKVEVREQKRPPECAMEHSVDVPMPQIVETGRLKEVNQRITRDRNSDCIDEQTDGCRPEDSGTNC